MTKLYVGNLPMMTTEDTVRDLFAAHGTVEKISLIINRNTGLPRGYGYIVMSDADASRAMLALNGKDLEGRAINISDAGDREPSGRYR